MQPAITIGIRIPHELFEDGDRTALRRSVAAVEASGIDRVCVGDHIAFHGGRGFDGLVQATALATLCDLEVQTAVYLANGLRPFVEAGCREFNLIPVAARTDDAIAGLAEVGRLLKGAQAIRS